MPNPLIGYERRAFLRQGWEDAWVEEPYLVPLVCSKVCAPGMDSATLLYSAGTIKREDSTLFLDYTPGDIRDWYVAIQTSPIGSGEWSTEFVGVVTDQDYQTEGVASYQGQTTIHCVGLQYILDRTPVKHSYAIGTTGPEKIEWVPGFNDRYERSHKIRGNRSDDQTGGLYYLHSEEKSIWTNKQIAQHLILKHSPAVFTFSIDGQHEALDVIEDVHNYGDGKTLWYWLLRLIPRRRGLTFTLDYNENDNSVTIRVCSLSDIDSTIGSETLPANDRPVTFTVPSAFPEIHSVLPITIRKTAQTLYDRIEVYGARIKITGTFSYESQAEGEGATLEHPFTAELVTDHEEGGPSSDPQEKDIYRSQEKFEGIYLRHVVPAEWPWTLGGETLKLDADDDGTVEPDENAGAWMGGKPFLRLTVFESTKDYSESPPANGNDPDKGAKPDFRPIMAFIEVPAEHGGGFHLVDKISECTNGELPNLGLRPLDNQMGFQLVCHPNHLMAKVTGGEDGGYEESMQAPRMDFRKLSVTATFESDTRLRVAETLGFSADLDRILRIDVPSAEYWYVVPGTICDVNGGDKIAIHGDNVVLRDDTSVLEGVLAFAKAWYARERHSASITIQGELAHHVDVGSMLTTINGAYYTEGINSIISGKTYRFGDNEDTVTVDAGWEGFDLGQELTVDLTEDNVPRTRKNYRRPGRGAKF